MRDDAERFEDALKKFTQAFIIEGNFSAHETSETYAFNRAVHLAEKVMAETDRRFPRTN